MKIAMIGSRGINSSYSGIEAMLREICPRLAERGHEITIFSEKKRQNDIPNTSQNIKIVRVPCLNGKHFETLTRSALATVISIKNNFDILNFHAQGSGIFSIIARVFRKKNVVTVQGLDWKRDKWSRFARLSIKTAERAAVKFADRIVVVSRVLEKYFQSTYGRETIYIPNGINSKNELANSQEISSFGLQPYKYILFASRLVPEKGCHELIEAYKQLVTDKMLVIAGGASYQDPYIRKLKQMASNGNIIFTGHVTGNLLEELYRNTYLFVLPSHIEGLSIALLEAMSYNKCVLVSNIPENLEVIEKYAYSFEVGNISSLKEKLFKLVENEEKVKSKEKQIGIYVSGKYNWDRIADRYENLFISLIKE